MDGGAMTWHGHMPHQAEWTEETRLVAFSVSSPSQGGLYCAFNTSHKPQTVTLPHWPGLVWQPVMDSGKVLPAPIQTSSCTLTSYDAAVSMDCDYCKGVKGIVMFAIAKYCL